MVSRKNVKYKQQQEAKQVPHYGIRKLSIGVASVLLGTVFYMQNGTVHADVNPTVSDSNNSVEVVNENLGTDNSSRVSNTSNHAGSVNSVSSTGDATNSIATRQVSASPVEKTTSQVNAGAAVNEPGSGTPASQANVGTSSIPVQNHPVSVSTGNIGNGRWFFNLEVNPSILAVSKVASTGTSNNAVNGGFDQSQWGTLDVSKWTGQENNGVYELIGYTGDLEHIIVPNSADFAKAGRNVGQVGISADTTHSWFVNGSPKSIAFSKTDGQMVKAVGSNWTGAFTGWYNRNGGMLYQAHSLMLFDGNNLDTSNISNVSCMFAQDKLTDLSGVSNWKTDNVTDMDGMFSYNQISNLAPLTSWKTDNVTNMSSMFSSNQISDLAPLTSWKTDNVTNMDNMFSSNRISNLTPLSNWKTDNVTNMSGMFSSNQISNLMPLFNWKTDNVTNMSSMFNSNQISDLTGLSNWKTDNVTDMDGMFSYNQISNLTPLTNWKTDNVTNMRSIFAVNQISDLTPLANWKTDNVTDMYSMFWGNQISDLTPITNWNINNVTNMMNMFVNNQISDLTPLANWKTDNVTNMNGMFVNNQISDLTPIANWKTDNVTDMGGMFSGNQISYADFTKWNFSKGLNLYHFIKQSTPAIIIVKNADDQTLLSNSQVISTKQNQLHFGSDTVDMPTVYVASDKELARNKILSEINIDLTYYKIFHANADDIKPVEPLDQLTKLVDLANAKFTVKHVLPELDTNDAFALDPANGLHEHKNVNDNGGYDTDFWGTLDVSKFTTVKNGDNLEITGYTGDVPKVIIPNIADFELDNLDQGAKQVTISSQVMHQLTKNATRIGLSKTNNQKVVASDAIWQDAFGGQTNAPNTSSNAYGGMWVYNPNLTVMDLHNLDTTNITDMDAMFNGGRNLNVVGDLSQWNTANVTSMRNMFQTASSVTNIGDLNNWNTSKVIDMTSMFGKASKLANIGDLSKWNVSKVTNMHAMFGLASSLINIGDLSKWNTSKVTDMSFMFNQTSKLENIGNLSKWNVSNVTNMTSMFQLASSLINIGDLNNWNTSKVTDMSYMFNNASRLANIGDLSKWDTSKVVGMSHMFNRASSLMNIGNLSKWDVSKVTDMSAMFSNASRLTSVGDLSKWDVSNVTDMRAMFQLASSLTNIGDLDNWNTSKVTDMSYMFSNASRLANIGDLSKWDVSNVTNMRAMFPLASSLTNIGDLSKWNTSKVTDMSVMFYSMTALKQLNISNWNLTKLTDKGAFQYFVNGDPNLVVIANNVKLPSWYQNELSNSNSYWNDHLVVITNNEALLKAIGSVDNVTVDNASVKRLVFYNSNGSDDAVAVLKQANQAYIKQYQNDHPGYTLNLASDVDQTDPIALANAKFVSAPLDVQFKLAYYDLTGKLIDAATSTHKVGETVSIAPVAPDSYVLVSGQAKADYLMRWGLNEADFLVEPKVTMTTETKTVSRTIKVQTPDGQTNNVVQTVKFVRNGYLNQVTKQTTYSSWSFGGQYQFSSYQPKSIDGYTVDVVPGMIVTPDSSDTMVDVAYHKQAAVYSVDYQLANGTVVKNVSVTPENNRMVHLTAPQGYRLLASVTDVQVGHSSQKLAVLVVPDEHTYTAKDTLPSTVTEPLTKTITRTVKIMMPNGRTRTVTQSVKFERTATVNVDGTVSYSDWQAIGRAQFNKVFVPKRFGYHFAGQADKLMVTADMTDSIVEIKYVKN